jgi:hypothetical protein
VKKKLKKNQFFEEEAEEASDESESDDHFKEIDRVGEKEMNYLLNKSKNRRDIVKEMEKKYT